jgi:quercetin dioxygenase-like cupin family protein
MQIFKIEDMKKGWFIGDFEPSAFKTSLFEVGTTLHPKGSSWDTHYHKDSTEITFLLSGKMKIQDQILVSGDVFVIPPYEIADPEFLEDCRVIVIKTPSAPGDKHIVEKKWM